MPIKVTSEEDATGSGKWSILNTSIWRSLNSTWSRPRPVTGQQPNNIIKGFLANYTSVSSGALFDVDGDLLGRGIRHRTCRAARRNFLAVQSVSGWNNLIEF
ncbi:hypothetical protein J6590_005955 [Homalodisca vitripennis]|nr:hypothetical protein J6590_005955 [Homalodisca vitripennis]